MNKFTPKNGEENLDDKIETTEEIIEEETGEDSAAVAGIAAKLGKKDAAPAASETAPASSTTNMDFLKTITFDQLQQLKSMLNATPERIVQKLSNPIVTLKRLRMDPQDEVGKLVVDFKNCFMVRATDQLTNMTSERLLIPIKFIGETEFINWDYRDFINAETVKCEILSRRQEAGRIVEGQVVSKEKGILVEMEVKTLKEWFTLKLPEGESQDTIEIEAKVANA